MASITRPFTGGTTSGYVVNSSTILHGVAAKCTTAAAFNVRNGDGGDIVLPITLADGESTSEVIDFGVNCPLGVYVEVVSPGTGLTISCWVK